MNQFKIKINESSLIIDFYKSEKETKKIAILLPGLPYKPQKYDLVDQLNDIGFDVAFLHYPGTHGSGGEFLLHKPQEYINVLINKIQKEGLNNIKYDGISIIGTSFGGAISITIDDNDIIKKVIALSPVISYKKVPTINTLAEYLTSNFYNEYNFSPERFNDLTNDQITSPINQYKLDPNKVLLIGGQKDEEIDINDIKSFSEQNNIKHLGFNTGHITFSRISYDILEAIKDFLK